MAQLDTKACTWKGKITVDDTINFGGDLAATGSSPASWSSGGQSVQRVAALAPTDYLEIDFTFDAHTAGHGILVGLASQYVPPSAPPVTAIDAAWVWDTDNHLKAQEPSSASTDIGVITLPMSCRIIYDAGVLTWRSNAGVDTLRKTTSRTVSQIYNVMQAGLQVIVLFNNTSGKVHVTLKGGDASTPEVGWTTGGTGRLGLPFLDPAGMDMRSYNRAIFRTLDPQGFPPPDPHPRPTEGKIWPRKH